MKQSKLSRRVRRNVRTVLAEALDRRVLMSGNPPAVLANGVLTITGTSAADAISVSFSTDQSTAAVTGTFTTVVNGTTQSFNTPGTTSVVVNSGQGNDTITVNGVEEYEAPGSVTLIPVNLAITAGDGNDTVTVNLQDNVDGGISANPSVNVTAGNGNDSLSVYGGDQIELTAGNGNDTLESSQFMDQDSANMFAGNGNDTFIAGSTLTGNQSVNVYAGTGSDTFENTDVADNMNVNLGQSPDPGSVTFAVPYAGAAFTGTAFVDENGTGVYATNDPVLPNTTVYLDNSNDGTVDSGDPSAVTDATGHYVIGNLDPTRGGIGGDSYGTHIRIAPTAGYTASDAAVTVNLGVAMSSVNPYLTPASTRLTGTLMATAGSYSNDGNTAANAVDGNLSTFFDGPTASGDYVGLNLGTPEPVTSIQYAPRAGFASRMVGGVFQGSNSASFSSATTLYTITTAPAAGVYTTVSVANPGAYQYVRYVAPTGSYGNVAEVQFYGIATPVTVNNGALTATGTTGADNISVAVSLDQEGDYATTPNLVDYGTYVVKLNGVTQTFDAGGITALMVNSLDGNDTVSVSGSEYLGGPPVNVSLVAGNGNDSLTADITTTPDDHVQPTIAVSAGNGNDTVTLSGIELQATLGNGNDAISTYDNGQQSYATIVAGNGNDTYSNPNAFQATTLTAGSGADVFMNTDPDSTEAVTITGGESFAVPYNAAVVTGKAYIDSNGDGRFESGEPVLGNTTVSFSTSYSVPPGTVTGTTTTDLNGNYVYNLANTSESVAATTTATAVAPVGYVAVPVTTAFSFSQAGTSGYADSGVNLPVVSQPALTGTLVATAGSYNNLGNTAAKAVDGNLTTFFDGPTANGNYVGLNLGTAYTITSISYAPRPGWASRMVGGIFQGSNSASFTSPVTLYTITATPVTGSLTTVTVSNPQSFQYVRYLSPNGSYGDVAEVQFFGTAAPAAVFSNGTLTVNGTSGADNIQIDFSAASSESNSVAVLVTVNGVEQAFNGSSITSLVVNTGQGNDSVSIFENYEFSTPGALTVQVNAGDGNDTITSSIYDAGHPLPSNLVTIIAGNGNDSVTVGLGDDAVVQVGNGTDSVDIDGGGNGADLGATVTAGAGNDLFEIGGSSSNNVTLIAGAGQDRIVNENSDNELTATFGNGPTITPDGNAAGVEGLAYVDNNGDGVFDAGDTVLANTQVYVDANGNGVFDPGETMVATNAQGYYFIPNLGSLDGPQTADYPLRVTTPAGYVDKTDTVALTVGDVLASINLAVTPPAPLTGTLLATAGSYSNDGNTAANAVDGNLSTFFDGPTANGDYVGLDLGTAKVITSIEYAPRPGFASRMVGGIFQGSNSANFSSPSTLYTINAAPAAGVYTTVAVTNTTAFRYVRYLSPTGSYGDIAEVQFFGSVPTPVVYANGSLTITGTAGADNIAVQLSGGGAGSTTTNVYTTTVNGVTQSFNVSSVSSIVINSGDGNDTIAVSTAAGYTTPTTLSLRITVGAGNDSVDVTLLNGDSAFQNATVIAGNGNDSILFDQNPESGVTDVITVGSGNDTVTAGDHDAATITAGNGNDDFTADDSYSMVVNAGTGRDTLVNAYADQPVTGTFGGGPAVTAAVGTFSAEGLAFVDNNGNGIYDAGDTVLANTQVYVDVNNDGAYDTGDIAATTNAQGYYFLANLDVAGTGTQTYNLRVNNTGSTTPVVINRPATTGAVQANVNLPVKPVVVPTGSISVHLFNDTNGNGVQDTGEPGLSGFGTFLDLNDNGVFDGSDIRMLADTSGNMTFSNLSAGTYWLEQIVPAGYTVTVPTTGFPIKVTVTANGVATVTVGEQHGPTKFTGTAIGTIGSYNNSGNTIANVFDGNLVTYFDAPTASGSWVGLDLGTAKVATQVEFSPRPSFESRMLGGAIQASNTADFSSGVVTLATITTLPTPGVLNTLSLNNSTAYRYYRYIGAGESYCDIAELEFFG